MGENKQSETNKSTKAAARTGRQERLAEALRANLNRRKAQIRARRDPGVDAAEIDVETPPD